MYLRLLSIIFSLFFSTSCAMQLVNQEKDETLEEGIIPSFKILSQPQKLITSKEMNLKSTLLIINNLKRHIDEANTAFTTKEKQDKIYNVVESFAITLSPLGNYLYKPTYAEYLRQLQNAFIKFIQEKNVSGEALTRARQCISRWPNYETKQHALSVLARLENRHIDILEKRAIIKLAYLKQSLQPQRPTKKRSRVHAKTKKISGSDFSACSLTIQQKKTIKKTEFSKYSFFISLNSSKDA